MMGKVSLYAAVTEWNKLYILIEEVQNTFERNVKQKLLDNISRQ